MYFLVKFYIIAIMDDISDQPQSHMRCNYVAISPQKQITTKRRGRNKVPKRSRRGCRYGGD